MGANSTQGWAVVAFLLAFTFLGGAMYSGGGIVMILLFLVTAAASVGLFLKCKPWEDMEK